MSHIITEFPSFWKMGCLRSRTFLGILMRVFWRGWEVRADCSGYSPQLTIRVYKIQ
jgi:hypothetical protein